MSELFLKVSGTSFLLCLFVIFLAAVFVDKDELLAKEWEEQPKHTRIIGLYFIITMMSAVTSLFAAAVSKIWGL